MRRDSTISGWSDWFGLVVRSAIASQYQKLLMLFENSNICYFSKGMLKLGPIMHFVCTPSAHLHAITVNKMVVNWI